MTDERTLLIYAGRVSSLEWQPDGTQLAYTSRDGEIFLLDTNSFETNSTLNNGRTRFIVQSETAQQMAWNPDGSQIALFDNTYGNQEKQVIENVDIIFVRDVQTDRKSVV